MFWSLLMIYGVGAAVDHGMRKMDKMDHGNGFHLTEEPMLIHHNDIDLMVEHGDEHHDCNHDNERNKLMMVLMNENARNGMDSPNSGLKNVMNMAATWNKMATMADLMTPYIDYKKTKDVFMKDMKTFCYMVDVAHEVAKHNHSSHVMPRKGDSVSDVLEGLLSLNDMASDVKAMDGLMANLDAFSDVSLRSAVSLCEAGMSYMSHARKMADMKASMGLPTDYDI
ncbi:uncharacterized protein LOC128210312 isoform X1 [Mya arenaria]|uniref:uncharacterized protein LOC128210312 isoform X1 n=1 Tax=Mya arenaria TaxID=6604 RepID=UPI0022E5F5F7|nr:uncharacterized protein LOC128210312 isoform X1 [Mya arenaria]XP_052770539.1 uncharacterized protein LOC128210312 isoform X1 [Mya arenaria]